MIRFARSFILMMAVATATPSILAQAPAGTDYPKDVVRIVVPFPAGGSTDLVARFIANGLTKKWDRPVIVENRPGAGATIGAALVAKATPDGHTLLVATTAANAIAPAVYPNLPYDPLKSFTPIMGFTTTPSVIAVNPNIPARTLQEFIQFAKTRPGDVSFSSPGSGVSSHLAMENFARAAGLKLVHVPYKGSPQALSAVVSGEVAITFDPISLLAPLARAGKVRALAVSSAERSHLLPEVPTIDEAGMPGLQSYAWNGLMGPAGMEPRVVQKIYQDSNAILSDSDLVGRLKAIGTDILPMPPEAFARYVRSEIDKWGTLARRVGAKTE